MDSLIITNATANSLAEILEIENISFPSPWDEETFLSTFEDKRCISALARENGVVVGYCLALGLASMVHILNLAVHPHFQRHGVARRLIKKILMDASAQEKIYAVLEVRKSNVPARSLYTSLGFSHVSTWRKYYTDTNEDAAIMVKDLRSIVALDVECTIIQNVEVAAHTFHMVLEGDMPPSLPGQFAMVQVSGTNEPFLRRPLAILGNENMHQELLYRIRGEGTLLLSTKKAGESIKLLGPLGRGFTRHDGKEIIYLAGGTGLPPILSLAERIKSGHFIIGAKNRHEIPLLERIKSIANTKVVITTEDGSLGIKGLATDALLDIIKDKGGEDTVVYACGPEGMLREASRLSAQIGFMCEVSLEERMSCGFGACTSCAVRTLSGNMRVCREGPVFNACDIVWR
ncbi:MAG TPA: ribosomal protein S18-alanine N-acetyltransferase [Desulfomonilia bacterium]|nr:ribosomal protein S18-alanine N-acetyltransferase [Desulfomonilia bacterium]